MEHGEALGSAWPDIPSPLTLLHPPVVQQSALIEGKFSMTTNPDDKRHAIIYADNEADLLRLIEKIPGYHREELEEDTLRNMMLSAGETRFYLRSEDGERIIVRHEAGKAEAETVNVMNQDGLDHPVPIHQDEVVKLHNAIKGVDDLFSQVVAAEIDLLPPSKDSNI